MASEYKHEKFEEDKDRLIQSWIKNGADSIDAEQLWDDMINDPYHSDPDMDTYFDPTIDDRLKKYSSKN